MEISSGDVEVVIPFDVSVHKVMAEGSVRNLES
jgi:hypothetical protein